MSKIKSSDSEFNMIYETYKAYVFKIVINETHNKITKEDMEDVVSDIFFLLWKNYKKIKSPKKVKSYLGKIAKNTAKNRLRNINKNLDFEENNHSHYQSNGDTYDTNEQLEIIHNELKKMDIADKKIFLMYYYENKKIKEISKLENINTSTIKTRLHRTRKKLKRVLEKKGFKYER